MPEPAGLPALWVAPARHNPWALAPNDSRLMLVRSRKRSPCAADQDERVVHAGHEECSTEKYADLVTEPIEQIVGGDRVIVRCKVSGDFPNSLVMLNFAFTLADRKISLLEIQ